MNSWISLDGVALAGGLDKAVILSTFWRSRAMGITVSFRLAGKRREMWDPSWEGRFQGLELEEEDGSAKDPVTLMLHLLNDRAPWLRPFFTPQQLIDVLTRPSLEAAKKFHDERDAAVRELDGDE